MVAMSHEFPFSSTDKVPRERASETHESRDVLAADQDPSVDEILENPAVRSYTTIEYEVGEREGRELKPGRSLLFHIPKEFTDRVVRDVILKHRKAEKYCVNIGPDGWDPHGAYSRVEMHDRLRDQWRGWQDPSGYSPVKFAEPRPAHDPENEVLHDWIATVGEIKADAARVTNVGNHPEYSTVQVHGFEVVFFPELGNVRYDERIYCAGTEFIDIEEGKRLPTYGGGEHTQGQYEQAVVLNQRRAPLFPVRNNPGERAKLEEQRLVIELESGEKLAQIEVAVGDSEYLGHPDSTSGQRTRLGWAKLWVGIRKKGGDRIEWFIQNANIPPQGVISGAPLEGHATIHPGDEIVVEARADTAYVMGWRIAYRTNENVEQKGDTL